MDGGQFDALARLVSTMQSRRAALAALLGAALLGTTPGIAVAKPKGKGKRNQKTTEARRGGDRGGDRRRRARKGRGQTKRRKDRDQVRQRRAESTRTTQAEAVACCGTRTCPLPGPGSQSAGCDFAGADLAGLDLTEAHLGKIIGTGADFSGAIARGASFGAACLSEATFIGADLRDTQFGAACLFFADLREAIVDVHRTLRTALLCGTTMPDGSASDRNCDEASACCPQCSAARPCGPGEVCCDGRCVAGECCTNAECLDPQTPICRDRVCVPCTNDGECGSGRICCDGPCVDGECCVNGERSNCGFAEICCEHTCFAGVCCEAADCANEICQTKRCDDHRCAYTPVFGESGPECGTLCCRSANGEPDCCEAGTLVCTPTGLCRCRDERDCAAGEVCCDGTCETRVWANETTFGNGPRSEGGVFQNIIGVAVSGNEQTAWVVDQGQNTATINEAPRVSVWTRQANGQWVNEALFGSSGLGPGQFSLPYGVAVSDDGLTAFVTDQGSLQTLQGSRVTVWRKQPNGSWTNPFSLGNGTGSGLDQFRFPTGVAVSGDGQTLWVVDTGNRRVSVWGESNGLWAPLTTFGSDGFDPGQFRDPTGIAVSGDGQTAWVIDRIRTRVSVWTRQANGAWTFDTEFGSFGDGPDQWRGAQGVAVAADGQTAFVSDLGHDRIMIWTRQPNGDWAHLENFGGPGNGRNQLDGPFGVAAAANGQTVWVSDQNNFRVSVWSLGCPAP